MDRAVNSRKFLGGTDRRAKRALRGGLGALPPAGSRGRAPGRGARGAPRKIFAKIKYLSAFFSNGNSVAKQTNYLPFQAIITFDMVADNKI